MRQLEFKANQLGRVFAYQQCFCCKELKEKSSANFHVDSRSRWGFKGTCKACLKARRKPEWSQKYNSSPKGRAVAAKAYQRYAQTIGGKAARHRAYKNWLSKPN